MMDVDSCPFCGGKARDCYVRDGRQVRCTTCGASGPSEFHGPADGLSATDRAVAAWNRRAQALAVPAGWQPIATAPRGSGEDGPGQTTHPDYIAPPRLLLATAEGIVVGYYDWYYHPGYGVGAEPNESVWRDHDGGRTYGVTHWMPLPAAPQEPRDA